MKSTAEGDAENGAPKTRNRRLLVLREEKFNSVELDLQSLDDQYQNALTELSKEKKERQRSESSLRAEFETNVRAAAESLATSGVSIRTASRNSDERKARS